MSTREDREQEARETARDATVCLGCALGLTHSDCDAEEARA